MTVQPVPEGYHSVTPYLIVTNAQTLLDFLRRAFGAKESYVMKGPAGEVRHADFVIGDSHVMIGEANGPWQPTPATLYLYVSDCDDVYRRAIDAGGVSVQEPKTQFYGDRHGAVKDACGNTWWVATHVEDVSPQEIERRAAAQS